MSPHDPEEPQEDQAPLDDPATVFRTGRRLDAELARGRLEADGIQAWIWSGGMGPWRMESALTEITGVPNDFNAHQVVVAGEDEERAREVLDEVIDPPVGAIDPNEDPFGRDSGGGGLLQALRPGWIVKGFAFVTLAVILWSLLR